MEIKIYKETEQLNRKAAEVFEKQIRQFPKSILGLATGSTPLGLYAELIKMHREEGLDFEQITTFNLDEYVGLSTDHPCSYRYYMNENLFDHINAQKQNIHLPNGLAQDAHAECEAYEKNLSEKGYADLQILGMGHNGHIGFNEPGTPVDSLTHVVDLTESTIKANARFFENEDQVPRQAMSMGIKSIMKSKKILLLVTGTAKAEIVHRALYEPITPEVPASILQLHPNLIVILDEEAGQEIMKREKLV